MVKQKIIYIMFIYMYTFYFSFLNCHLSYFIDPSLTSLNHFKVEVPSRAPPACTDESLFQ